MRLILGDCLDVMAGMEPDSVDAIVTDPPYGLEFMGKEWDKLEPGRSRYKGQDRQDLLKHTDFKNLGTLPNFGNQKRNPRCLKCGKFQWDHDDRKCKCAVPAFKNKHMGAEQYAWHRAWAEEAWRVLKPAHYLMAFGGTRTWHRLAVALEDAGFEIRDTLMWLYGSGFPKGKGNLKPAWEPIILCRKPGAKVRPLGIDECRIEGVMDGTWGAQQRSPIGYGHTVPTLYRTQQHPSGRWPANIILDPNCAAMLDEQSGERPSQATRNRPTGKKQFASALGGGTMGTYGDSGGASRFFYCAKASRAERNRGCEGLEAKVKDAEYRQPTGDPPVDRIHGCGVKATNHHPTVKPVALMSWLVRLITPPGGTVLDPFMGSGTTGVAAVQEGRFFVGVEREPEYLEIAKARIDYAEQNRAAELEGFVEVAI